LTIARRRLGILLLALAVLIPLLQKSRAVSPVKQAAFLRYTAGSCLVKIYGTGKQDGIYRFSDGATLADVKKMTNIPSRIESGIREGAGRCLKNGDMVVFTGFSGSNSSMSLKNMTVAERISLGIPLDPDAMSAVDWESLPGIGPALAEAIVADRQKNGAFNGLNGIVRVPGVGQGTLKTLQTYFNKDVTASNYRE